MAPRDHLALRGKLLLLVVTSFDLTGHVCPGCAAALTDRGHAGLRVSRTVSRRCSNVPLLAKHLKVAAFAPWQRRRRTCPACAMGTPSVYHSARASQIFPGEAGSHPTDPHRPDVGPGTNAHAVMGR